MRFLTCLTVASVVVASHSASAQTIELGGGLSTGSFGVVPAVQARANLTSRFAIDVDALFKAGHSGVDGLHFLQLRTWFGRPQQTVRPFATGGMAGEFEIRHSPEPRYSLPTGDTTVYREHTLYSMGPPVVLVGGGGVSVRLARRAFIEVGGRLAFGGDFLVPFFSIGLSVPVGHSRSR